MLVSVDGLAGKELIAAAKRLLRSKGRPDTAFSSWDASGIFFEIQDLPGDDDSPSARTLLLLYAADLRFRLRWEIGPAIELGHTVVAAPYVETAIAFGRIHRVSRRWMKELFRFAPPAKEAYWVNVESPGRARTTSGFIEFCRRALPAGFDESFMQHFNTLEKRGKCRGL